MTTRKTTGFYRSIRILTVLIPWLPPRELGANASRYCPRGLKNRLLAEARAFASVSILDARNQWERDVGIKWQPLEKAVMDISFTYPVSRRRDADNLIGSHGTKTVIDMLTQLDIIADDDTQHLKLGNVDIIVDKERAPLTILGITGG